MVSNAEIHDLVFPAHAGMNRQYSYLPKRVFRVPRPRGDEPYKREAGCEYAMVFPAHAGMNRFL